MTKFKFGDRVRYENSRDIYEGFVAVVRSENSYKVVFDDGYFEILTESELELIKPELQKCATCKHWVDDYTYDKDWHGCENPASPVSMITMPESRKLEISCIYHERKEV